MPSNIMYNCFKSRLGSVPQKYAVLAHIILFIYHHLLLLSS